MNLPALVDGLTPGEWDLAVAYRDADTHRRLYLDELVALRADYIDQGRRLTEFADALDQATLTNQETATEHGRLLELLADTRHTADQHRQTVTVLQAELRQLRDQPAHERVVIAPIQFPPVTPIAHLVDIAAQVELPVPAVQAVIDGLEVVIVDGHARFTCNPNFATVRPGIVAKIARLHWNQTHPANHDQDQDQENAA